jgi:3',5'-cyclic-AMP phosphodiesterase
VSACCHLTRRQLLRYAGLVAATPLVSAIAGAERAIALPSGGMVATNLELVTLTETSAILTWFTGDPGSIDAAGRFAPVPANTEVLLGSATGSLRTVLLDDTRTPFHYAEVTGLEPGRPYVFMARSDGVVASPSASTAGSPIGTSTAALRFTTPEPPTGAHVLTVALCNDLHLGETVAGLATTQQGIELPPGIRQRDGLPPYPEIMSTALVRETHERGARHLLVAGDVSAEARAPEVARAKELLDSFDGDYLVARGNHDRVHPNQEDVFADAFFGDAPTWSSNRIGQLRVLGLDTYDKIGNGGDNGMLSPDQLAFVRDELARDPERPTIVFGHHPVSLESSVTTTEPIIFDLDQQQAMQLEAMYAASPGVFLHHAGHTHRNKRTISEGAPGVVFQEVAAAKEYPGGFTLLRLFTGGYALNYFKLRDPLAQEWAERSRPEYGGLAPFYTYGNLSDRNTVVTRDLSDLKPSRA